ncbi:hypothetical protein DWG18_07830 [Lysobacter sp. TY2-98]|uniref:hypothetical protein n=1 Tax=Lysobacter sp. TY2-98 TaxID=2290922 RepID=UPI000E205729|nr:hypothetical protein [Lysobacter sp. TY2-98]AXK72201.1 hypothetical protein DWG18_07830 [Lysobacter sp. TY2-98]
MDNKELAVRCHEIQTGLANKVVDDFEQLTLVGSAVRLALHIQGLPTIDYEKLKLVASHFLDISPLALRAVVEMLAEVEFVKLATTGRTIDKVVPDVPYYESLYETIGEYAADVGLNETEQLSVELLRRLAKSPDKLDALRNAVGADSRRFDRAVSLGVDGGYIKKNRHRGKDLLLSPAYFTENADIFADAVAKSGAKGVQRVLQELRNNQGVPLSVLEAASKKGNSNLTADEIAILQRLAGDGVVRPPTIVTSHSGENHFMFTPTPGSAALAGSKREIYERAMAIVAAIRQGQYLPREFAVRNPAAIIGQLKHHGKLGRATTEAREQYQNLQHLRIARLVPVGNGYAELHVIETQENTEALEMAYQLVTSGGVAGIEVDEDARRALQQEQHYVESLIASAKLKESTKAPLSEEAAHQLEIIFNK